MLAYAHADDGIARAALLCSAQLTLGDGVERALLRLDVPARRRHARTRKERSADSEHREGATSLARDMCEDGAS
jgi:hypothetical protein